VLGLEATVDGDDGVGIEEASGTKTPGAPEELEGAGDEATVGTVVNPTLGVEVVAVGGLESPLLELLELPEGPGPGPPTQAG
jgi:hypothetical protein